MGPAASPRAALDTAPAQVGPLSIDPVPVVKVQRSLSTLDILGLKVSSGEFCDNAEVISAAALGGRGQWVMTLNLEMVARMATDEAYQTLVRDVDWAVADGLPIVWLSHLRGKAGSIPSRSCGVDLTAHFLKYFSGRLGILGGVAVEGALAELNVPRERIVFLDQRIITPNEIDDIAAKLNASGCQLLLVALGVPKQDYVCQALRKQCPGLVCMGVGGSFEILAGVIPRAPEWVQNLGFEWLYRLCGEPRRLWRRYLLHYPRAVPRILKWIRAHLVSRA